MAKKLIINCGTCDARNVQESTLEAYESITINSGDVIVTPESKALLNSYGAKLNCGEVLELEKDVKIQQVNGKFQIRSTDVLDERVYLTVNGKLDIGPDTQEVLSQYVGIFVNGKVLCPESVSGCLGKLHVNGKTLCYPDGAIVLKANTAIDRTFALRAKEKLYWADKRLIMVDPALDAAALARKGATFSAEEIIIAESLVEALIDRIDEKAEIVIVPDGTAVVADDLNLTRSARKRYGSKICVLGDLEVGDSAEEALAGIEYLNVVGDVTVTEAMHDALVAVLTHVSGDLVIKAPRKGRYFKEKMSLRISKWLLESDPDGVTAEDCLEVSLDPDVPNDLIVDRLRLKSCLNVRCTAEQEPAVAIIAEDVMSIGPGDGDEEKSGIGGIVSGAMGALKGVLDTKIINAGDYVL